MSTGINLLHTEEDIEWLLELLSQNEFIPINDGLGTFIFRHSKGWQICGRDDVMALLSKRLFDSLSFALVVAKSLKKKFMHSQKRN